MRFINTVDYFKGIPHPVTASLEQVLFEGQAPQKGLYVPESIVHFSPEFLKGLKGLSYAETAFRTLYPYFDEIPEADFKRIIGNAYGSIQAPIRELYPRLYCLELFHNWTLAFKDFAAQLLASVMEYYLEKRGQEIVIFVGTSGDTGPAIDEAFFGKKNVKVYCLYPKGKVTDAQRKQMTTLGGNIYPVEVEGDFHDCQELAKSALADQKMARFNPTSANSINWGRFIPQSVFSYWLYSHIADFPEEIVVSIPTGNAGHIGSNFLAMKSAGGLPIKKFIAPHNMNNYFARMLEAGKESVEVLETFDCISNAMNVKVPNNIPRILYLFGRDITRMQAMVIPVTVSDEETRTMIRKTYDEKGYILDVHGAVALAGTFKVLKANPQLEGIKIGVYLTADPAKFPEKISEVLGFEPPVPQKLKVKLDSEDKKIWSVQAGDLEGLRKIVESTNR
jgi:threonine synthase